MVSRGDRVHGILLSGVAYSGCGQNGHFCGQKPQSMPVHPGPHLERHQGLTQQEVCLLGRCQGRAAERDVSQHCAWLSVSDPAEPATEGLRELRETFGRPGGSVRRPAAAPAGSSVPSANCIRAASERDRIKPHIFVLRTRPTAGF